MGKEYSKREGVDYTEVSEPVARMDTVRMIISMAALNGFKIYQMDVKSAFLHGELVENVLVDQHQEYEKKCKEHLVYKLKNALYGLKQAPRAWYSKIETHFNKKVFKKCDSEQTLFTKISVEGDTENKKSTGEYVFILSSGAFAWSSKKQPIVTLSTSEAEFVAATISQPLSKNPVMHGRSKHIDVRYHFLRDLSRDVTIALIKCPSEVQVADIMTKPLNTETFQK
ncbi:hypothetical protein LIER_41127 [Lithospermum erythrorhizon]|uniref:Reverse transcriptase Ty1/copia-type domain-containing protein n=1 Tax=Lithospermum erythrorhizon TaxID=34254 RepID=A0AAV3R8T1_LITER